MTTGGLYASLGLEPVTYYGSAYSLQGHRVSFSKEIEIHSWNSRFRIAGWWGGKFVIFDATSGARLAEGTPKTYYAENVGDWVDITLDAPFSLIANKDYVLALSRVGTQPGPSGYPGIQSWASSNVPTTVPSTPSYCTMTVKSVLLGSSMDGYPTTLAGNYGLSGGPTFNPPSNIQVCREGTPTLGARYICVENQPVTVPTTQIKNN